MTLNLPFLKTASIQGLKNQLSPAISMFKRQKPPKTNLQNEQREKLIEIGSLLQKARLEQAVSLKGISLKTQIPIRTLEAIEAGLLEELPHSIYIRAIVKKYAAILNFESKEWLEEFSTEIETTQVKASPWSFKLPSFQIRTIHIYLFYIILVSFSLQRIAETLERPIVVINTEKINQTKSINKKIPLSRKPKNHPERPVVINIKLKEPSWLKVVVDGKTKFEGTLKQGSHQTWKAQQKLTLSTGNAGAVMVAFNKEQAKQLGKSGQKQQVTYHANSNL